MNHTVKLTTEQVLFLTHVVREYLDDEEQYGWNIDTDKDDVEKHQTRLVFYKTLHKKLSRKIYK